MSERPSFFCRVRESRRELEDEIFAVRAAAAVDRTDAAAFERVIEFEAPLPAAARHELRQSGQPVEVLHETLPPPQGALDIELLVLLL